MSENDWIRALARLTSGRTVPETQLRANPSYVQDILQTAAQQTPVIGGLFRPPERGNVPREGLDAVSFLSPDDPISQIAMLLTPMIRGQLRTLAARPSLSPMRQRFLGGQRGSTGGGASESMEELRRLTEERLGSQERLVSDVPGLPQSPEKTALDTEAQRRARSAMREMAAMDAGGPPERIAPPRAGSKEHLANLYERLEKQAAHGQLSPQDAKMYARLREHYQIDKIPWDEWEERALRLDKEPASSPREIEKLIELRDRLEMEGYDEAERRSVNRTPRQQKALKNLYVYLPELPDPGYGLSPENMEPF